MFEFSVYIQPIPAPPKTQSVIIHLGSAVLDLNDPALTGLLKDASCQEQKCQTQLEIKHGIDYYRLIQVQSEIRMNKGAALK